MVNAKTDFPKTESGYFHLTPNGWVRKDMEPFPADRCETWRYEMEWPAEDAKEQVTLTKLWVSRKSPGSTNEALHARFGNPVSPNLKRNIMLECRV